MVRRQKALTQPKIVALRAPGARFRKGPRPPVPPLPRYLTQAELAAFLQAIRSGGSLRDLVLFGLMYRFGLRAVEVTYLLLEDLDLARKRITIRRAKGGEPKEYPLPADLVQLLRRYLRKRPDRGPFLFVSREATNQKGMAQQRVRQLFKRYAAAAGLPANLASHALRHAIAVHALQEGFGLEYIADLLGHTSTRSTAIYAQIVAPAREAMMRRLDVSRHIVSWR